MSYVCIHVSGKIVYMHTGSAYGEPSQHGMTMHNQKP